MNSFAEIKDIQNPDQMARARRSQMYRFLAESLRYPNEDFLKMAREGGYLQSALALLHDIPFEITIEEGALSGELLKDVSQDDFEAEFVRIYDAGPGGPPCPLYEGKYAADRMTNMEDLVRFYNHFGLSVEEASEREIPDHITTELEFMHYLTFKEVLALQRQHRGALRTCYERALKRDDSLTDIKADVEVSIGDSGVVRAVNVTAGNNPELINCIRQRIKGWAFPAIGAQSFSFPIIFRGS